jgi:muconate cycloisomerase
MQIARIEAIPVCVPLKKGMTNRTAHGEHVVSPYVVICVHTSEGLVGLGEATVAPRWSGETARGCIAAIEELIAPALLGMDPGDITRIRRRMTEEIKLNPFTRAAVEMALWDLAGKAAGVPLYRLLGGKVRETVPIRMVIGAFDVGTARAMAEKFLNGGARCLKVKVGLDPAEDVRRVSAVRDVAGPAIPITIDANCGWTAAAARWALRRIEPLDLLLAEQPIPPGDPEALAELRRDVPVRILADESVFTAQDAWQLSLHRAADLVSVYPGKHGGVADTIEVVHVAKAGGLRAAMGSNLELGIASAAMLHLAVALPEIDSESFPGDIIGPLYHEADLLEEPLPIGLDMARVPDRPGLGVSLDAAQLARYRVD